jgi:hypothetical protein
MEYSKSWTLEYSEIMSWLSVCNSMVYVIWCMLCYSDEVTVLAWSLVATPSGLDSISYKWLNIGNYSEILPMGTFVWYRRRMGNGPSSVQPTVIQMMNMRAPYFAISNPASCSCCLLEYVFCVLGYEYWWDYSPGFLFSVIMWQW